MHQGNTEGLHPACAITLLGDVFADPSYLLWCSRIQYHHTYVPVAYGIRAKYPSVAGWHKSEGSCVIVPFSSTDFPVSLICASPPLVT